MEDDFEDDINEDVLNQGEMKKELIQAIHDERQEYETLKRQNEELQKKIILSDTNTREQYPQTDQLLNEHKYLNTLANVHQVRFNLKET